MLLSWPLLVFWALALWPKAFLMPFHMGARGSRQLCHTGLQHSRQHYQEEGSSKSSPQQQPGAPL